MSFVKQGFLSAAQVGVRALTALVLNKLVALRFGPPGITLLAHFQNFISLVISLPADGVHRGLVKNYAQTENEVQRSAFFRAAIWLSALLSAVTAMLIVVLLPGNEGFWQQTGKGTWVFVVVPLGVLYCIYLTYMSRLLAAGQLKTQVWVSIAGNLINIAFSGIIIWYAPLQWALVSILAGQVVILLFAALYVKNLFAGIRQLMQPLIVLPQAKVLLHFVGVALASAIFGRGVEFVVRQYAINHFAPLSVGYWQTAVRIGDFYITPFNSLIALVFFPGINRVINNKPAARKYLIQVFAWVVPASIVLLGSIWFLRAWVITLLSAPGFLPAQTYLQYQLPGDFFKIISYFLSAIVLARGRTKAMFFIEPASALCFILLATQLVPGYETLGFSMANMYRYVAYCFVMLLIAFYPSRANTVNTPA